MIGETAILLRLRWLVVVLFGLLWTTIGGAASLAERDHFGPSSFAAKGGVSGRFTPSGDVDHAANMIGNRFGGQASVHIKGFGNREFDFVSSKYVGQTFGGDNFMLSPKNFLSKSRRSQIRQTMEAAKGNDRSPLFNFEGGAPHADVLDFINRNAERIGVTPVITNFSP